ncbi:unnamed protein product [Sphagnum troendelagicum]|uniref:Fucosyltransferase n=1 Tax=Sphagnum troendelagicum TaxID=128251 RepID=A0ABP0V504_9BRYO
MQFLPSGMESYGENDFNADLEHLFVEIISPVATVLDGMKPDDKLIIVAPESHTISIAPSLRVLGHCDQRSKEFDHDLLLDKGAIVAVGDPAYGTFCGAPRHLKASGEEVNFIEELFGKEYVVKLVGMTATSSEMLKCAKYPSEMPLLNFRNSNEHFAVGFFRNPTLRPLLELMFPEHNILHLLAQNLFSPSEMVWNKVKDFYETYLSQATSECSCNKGEYCEYFDEVVLSL